MTKFKSSLTARDLEGDDWRMREVIEPLICWLDDERVIIVPPGFVTDGASIPRFLWAIYPPFGPWARAGVLHDYLCFLISIGMPHPDAMTRSKADRLFFTALWALDLPLRRCVALYLGACLGTWFGVKTRMAIHNAKLKSVFDATPAGV